ncbi:MAG: oligoribonuclease [Acidobacteria bacterium]|nr:oligoribonuclease [Acidobacteriota bacterium]
MDLEMTGLDPNRHTIVEIATLVTDDELNVIAEGPDLVLGASPEELAEMNDFVRSMHTSSGLLDQIARSSITMPDAEAATLQFLQSAGVPGRLVPLAGNSIGTDRRFLQAHMPALEAYFHYRNVDVSTIKELGQRWFPNWMNERPEKATTHRALDDIQESLAELRFYRERLFVDRDVTPKH